MIHVDTLIVGGGPSGLVAAIELGRRGLSVLLVEPRVHLDALRPRAKTTSIRTMEHFRRLGLAARLRAAAPIQVSYSQDVVFCTGPFGHEITRFENAFGLTTERQEDFAETSQQAPQPIVERVLRDHVSTLPTVQVLLGARVTSLEDGPQVGARVTTRHGEQVAVTARYAIGADGAGGISRQAIGARYEGASNAVPNVNITFRSHALESRALCARAVHYWVVGRTRGGLMGRLDLDGTWWAIVQGVEHPERVDPVSLIHELCGERIDVEVCATDPWRAHTLLVDRCAGRHVFLVGDAAHLNPPWGGHGFNTCVGDAVDLAWKLAARLRGWGGPHLMASYELERRPIAEQTLAAAAAQEAFTAPVFAAPALGDDTEDGRRLRRLAADAIQSAKHSEFHSLALVLGCDYGSSPIVCSERDTPQRSDAGVLVPRARPGARLPHAWLPDGRSVYDLLGPEFSVITCGEPPDAFVAASARTGVPVTVVDLCAWPHLRERLGAGLVLVRPDQHVAWCGEAPVGSDDVLRRAVGY